MNQSSYIFSARRFGVLLLIGAVLVAGCDSNSSDEDDPLTGTWQATVAVDWAETFALPEDAAIDSVRYLHAGTHRLVLRLTQTDHTVTGTVNWNVDGLFASNEYTVGNATTDVDDVNLDRDPEAATGSYDARTLTFERSGTTNDWLSPLDAVDFTLDAGELTGELVFRYLTTEWPVAGGQGPFTTTFEVPVPVRLTRTSSSVPN